MVDGQGAAGVRGSPACWALGCVWGVGQTSVFFSHPESTAGLTESAETVGAGDA